MAKAKVLVLCSLLALLPVSLCGTIAIQNRDTTLEELKDIDSYVSSASDLPGLEKGFFVGTSRGPVLVKSEPSPGGKSRPTVNTGYYNTLPRLIPAGFEGIATSVFNLGPANPYRPLSTSKGFLPVPASASIHPQQYIPAQPTPQYVQQPLQQSPRVYQPNGFLRRQYVPQPQPEGQQYIPQESSQPQVFQNIVPQQHYQQAEPQQANQQQQYVQVDQPQGAYLGQQSQQQFIQVEQPQQQFIQQDQPHQQFLQQEQPQQQFIQQEQPQQQFLQQEQPQQQFIQQEQPQQQFPEQEQAQPQFVQQAQPQDILQQQSPQQFRFHRQYPNGLSQQILDSQPAAQEPTRISARSHTPEPSFQTDNLLRPEQEQGDVQTYQTQVFGRERFESQQLLRNQAVLAASQQEETLPEDLRNRFYKNANLATILAQESLPVQGEQIINEWDTNKIAKGKIYALLSGAGFI